MAKGDVNEIPTVIVLGSHAVARPDGRAAIVLKTTHQTIAFEVTLETIQILRNELTICEQVLRQRPGHA
jgi:hypothetical protein